MKLEFDSAKITVPFNPFKICTADLPEPCTMIAAESGRILLLNCAQSRAAAIHKVKQN